MTEAVDEQADAEDLAERARQVEVFRETQSRVLASTFDRATTYATVIIFGGYAGLFAIWQLTRDHITKEQALWSALFTILSLTTFVLFEIYKMIYVSNQVFKKAAVIQDEAYRHDLQKMAEVLDGMERAWAVGLSKHKLIWAVSVGIAVLLALSAVATLAYAFVTALVKAAYP